MEPNQCQTDRRREHQGFPITVIIRGHHFRAEYRGIRRHRHGRGYYGYKARDYNLASYALHHGGFIDIEGTYEVTGDLLRIFTSSDTPA